MCFCLYVHEKVTKKGFVADQYPFPCNCPSIVGDYLLPMYVPVG